MRKSWLERGTHRWLTATLIGMALALFGCAETELLVHSAKEAKSHQTPPSKGSYKVGSPYQIAGVWYYPKEEWGYVETGIASWYGPGFHGKKTANGEVFDENDLTAAHRTLPMPSVVRVTNLDNGRSIVVRVNDRGPFAHGRILDLSRRSAQLLGFLRQGTAKVRVELVADETRQEQAAARGEDIAPPPDPTLPVAPTPSAAPTGSVKVAALNAPRGAAATPTPRTPAPTPAAPVAVSPIRPVVSRLEPEPTEIFIQAGSFQDAANAQRLTGQLAAFFNGTHVQKAVVSGETYYRVRIGPIASVDNADQLLERVIVAGYPGSRIVLD